jgi:hypothetical protein
VPAAAVAFLGEFLSLCFFKKKKGELLSPLIPFSYFFSSLSLATERGRGVNEGEAEKGDGSTEDVDDKRYKKAAGQQWHAGVQGCVVVGEVHLVTSLVLTRIQNVEFQKLELKWSARLSNKIVSLFPSPKFLDLILASTVPLGFKPC